jgi:hypothetical protein
MSDDNIFPIRPTTTTEGADPEWLKTADRLGRDLETGEQPMALDTGIPAREFLEQRGAADLLREKRAAEGRDLIEAEEPDLEPVLRESIIARGQTPEPVEEQRPKTRVLSAAERAAQAAEAERLEREAEASRKRFNEIDPLRRGVFYTALGIGIVIFITSGLFSYAAIAAAASWMRPEWAWLVLLVPGFVELFMVYFGIDGVVYQARAVYARTQPERDYYRKQAGAALVWMFVFAGVAVLGNGAHTTFRWLESGEIPWYGFVGIVMSALAPLSVVLITKRVSRLVFVYSVKE